MNGENCWESNVTTHVIVSSDTAQLSALSELKVEVEESILGCSALQNKCCQLSAIH